MPVRLGETVLMALEVLKSSWNKSLDKSLVVFFLTAKIIQLPATVVRTLSTGLWELADSWIRPYIEVKLQH